MSDWSPKSLWERVLQAFEGWMDADGDAEVDEASVAFFLLFIAPVFLAFVMLVRR
jgi:hypothetical protein